MIFLNFEGMCKGCQNADLKLECIELQSFAGETKKWEVNCKHENVCLKWLDKLEDSK